MLQRMKHLPGHQKRALKAGRDAVREEIFNFKGKFFFFKYVGFIQHVKVYFHNLLVINKVYDHCIKSTK